MHSEASAHLLFLVLSRRFPTFLSTGRSLQDYVILYFGTVVFKIGRLVAIAILSIHCFACAFYRVKIESAASPEDVDGFYLSRGVEPTVSKPSTL